MRRGTNFNDPGKGRDSLPLPRANRGVGRPHLIRRKEDKGDPLDQISFRQSVSFKGSAKLSLLVRCRGCMPGVEKTKGTRAPSTQSQASKVHKYIFRLPSASNHFFGSTTEPALSKNQSTRSVPRKDSHQSLRKNARLEFFHRDICYRPHGYGCGCSEQLCCRSISRGI